MTCPIFQELVFLNKFKAAIGELFEEPSKLIKGALPVTCHKRTRSTQSLCIKLLVPWRHVPSVDLGTYPVEEVCCRAVFTDIRSRYIHAVTYTQGRGGFHGEW